MTAQASAGRSEPGRPEGESQRIAVVRDRQFAQFLLPGLTVGAIYALVALGFSIIYNASASSTSRRASS